MHTAGPWVVSATGRYVRYQGMHGPNVCDLDAFGGPKEEGAANARLIAAAPELLAALEMFVSVCETAPPVELLARIGIACSLAKEAIAKGVKP